MLPRSWGISSDRGLTLVEVALALAILGSLVPVALGLHAATARANRSAALQARTVEVAAGALSHWRSGMGVAESCALGRELVRLGFACALDVSGCTVSPALACTTSGGTPLQQATVRVRGPDGRTLEVATLRYRTIGGSP